MSTRVDKANQKFKPVGRSRSKTANPPLSAPAESTSETPTSLDLLSNESSIPESSSHGSSLKPLLTEDESGLSNYPARVAPDAYSRESPIREAPFLVSPGAHSPANAQAAATSDENAETHRSSLRRDSNEQQLDEVPPSPDDSGHEQPVSQKLKRTRSTALLDTNLESGDPIDPTSTSMKDLCSSSGSGRVSSRYIELQLAHAQAKRLERERRARIAAFREAKDKRGQDMEEAVAQAPVSVLDPLAIDGEAVHGEHRSPPEDVDASAFDYKADLRSDHFTVSMRMDASGNMVVDEDSLVVDRAANPEYIAQMESMPHVEESELSHFVNSASHSRKTKGSRWSKEETALFYEALRQFNTDFTMISLIMPGRTARECRNKFNSEDRRNRDRIDWALSNPTPIDVAALSRLTGKEFD